jgi:hypothetical protein
MRTFSLLFVFIALVLLAQFSIYVLRGPVVPFIATVIFVSFLVCLAPYLLKPFEGREALRRRREARKERERRQNANGDP